MNIQLASCGALFAALLVGCGSAPKLAEASGTWESFNPPFTPMPLPQAVATNTAASTAVPSKPAPVPVKPSAPVVAAKQAQPVVIALPAKTTPVNAKPSSPGNASLKAKAAPATSVIAHAAPGPATTTVTTAPTKVFPSKVEPKPVLVKAPIMPPLVKPVEYWEVTPRDVTLRKALTRWAGKAGWQLVWEASVDVPINVTARFEGDFRTAIKNMFKSLSAADVNLAGMLYVGNKVLRVTESGRRAQ